MRVLFRSGWLQIGRSAPGRELPSDPVLCFPLLDPEGKPQMKTFSVDEEAADLIAAARDAKVFICTFAFLRTHWERLFATIPQIDNFMVDELHMGYGTAGSQQVDSFFYVTDRCSQFCGMTGRSEEHTSELQSLMRISYAVFSLTKKNTEQQIVGDSKV